MANDDDPRFAHGDEPTARLRAQLRALRTTAFDDELSNYVDPRPRLRRSPAPTVILRDCLLCRKAFQPADPNQHRCQDCHWTHACQDEADLELEYALPLDPRLHIFRDLRRGGYGLMDGVPVSDGDADAADLALADE